MSRRFDNRSVSTFKKDIKFGTMLEKWFFEEWLQVTKDMIWHWEDNGCDNNGEFIPRGNTSGADYRVTGTLFVKPEEQEVEKHPLEMKWVPTAGKFTLKEHDLKGYIREGASILFIYNSVRGGVDLRKPKNYDFDSHIKLLKSKSQQFRFGIMWKDMVKKLYEHAKEACLFQPIPYMGNKSGIILPEKEFSNWFISSPWVYWAGDDEEDYEYD